MATTKVGKPKPSASPIVWPSTFAEEEEPSLLATTPPPVETSPIVQPFPQLMLPFPFPFPLTVLLPPAAAAGEGLLPLPLPLDPVPVACLMVVGDDFWILIDFKNP